MHGHLAGHAVRMIHFFWSVQNGAMANTMHAGSTR